jgi:hypothetical protein
MEGTRLLFQRPHWRNAVKEEIKDRLDKNLARVRNLVEFFNERTPTKPKQVKDTDILRAATVFLHATLEDFLRSIAAWKLPLASADILNKIPLAGAENAKFTLRDLASHRDKKVAELIKLSVDTYLERSNYNNTNEVASLLEGLGVNVNQVNSTFGKLTELMTRRHQIVHRVDRKPTGKTSSLSEDEVNAWIVAVEEFTSAVLNEISD